MMKQIAYEDLLEEAFNALESARRLVSKDIADYPSPISGCDAQFNQLLSDRARISRAIQSLQEIPFVPTPRVLERGAKSEMR